MSNYAAGYTAEGQPIPTPRERMTPEEERRMFPTHCADCSEVLPLLAGERRRREWRERPRYQMGRLESRGPALCMRCWHVVAASEARRASEAWALRAAELQEGVAEQERVRALRAGQTLAEEG